MNLKNLIEKMTPAQRAEFAHVVADRAVRNYALGSVIDDWAQKWLSGEDRMEESAYEAFCYASFARGWWEKAAWAAKAARAAALPDTKGVHEFAGLAANKNYDTEIAQQIADAKAIIERDENGC